MLELVLVNSFLDELSDIPEREIGLYGVCSHKMVEGIGRYEKMKTNLGNEELRWQVVKAMIDEFPALKSRVKTYLEVQGD
ncbi:MAG TPA: hypothetical protein VJ066_05200 [Candidatus Bathyarchaeia archaeon]|nr:hypothetical protein [Candidatus Bathyarchaeia archaeon]